MSMSDPLSDLITRIRNAQMARKPVVECTYSKLHVNFCAVLKEEGYIREYSVEDRGNNKKALVVQLKYHEGKGAIVQIDRVSKPGRRVYSSFEDFQRFFNGLGILVVSTPKGVMADRKARKDKVGGEILCQVF